MFQHSKLTHSNRFTLSACVVAIAAAVMALANSNPLPGQPA